MDMVHPTDVHVGRRLREARLAKGMTQTDLGVALGVSFQQVQKYEKGMNRIGSSRLWDICKILDVTVVLLLRRPESRWQGRSSTGTQFASNKTSEGN